MKYLILLIIFIAFSGCIGGVPTVNVTVYVEDFFSEEPIEDVILTFCITELDTEGEEICETEARVFTNEKGLIGLQIPPEVYRVTAIRPASETGAGYCSSIMDSVIILSDTSIEFTLEKAELFGCA